MQMNWWSGCPAVQLRQSPCVIHCGGLGYGRRSIARHAISHMVFDEFPPDNLTDAQAVIASVESWLLPYLPVDFVFYL